MIDRIKAWLDQKYVMRTLMIVPPVLFMLYTTQSVIVIRNLMSDSSSFHLDYANDLVQDYLSLDMSFDLEHLRNCLRRGDTACEDQRWFTLEADGEPIRTLTLEGEAFAVFLNNRRLIEVLPVFFNGNRGLSTLFVKRHHDPVYWFQIVNPGGEPVFQSGQRPAKAKYAQSYTMDRTLKGYSVEIVYNSFGAEQLYSVASTKINFGAIFFLFLLVIFSAFLMTRAIRQKIILARQKSFFVSTVSHEFKTPLAIMKLAAETLAAKRFKHSGDEAKFLGMLTNEINRLNHLVHKILSFNKIETGQIFYHNQMVDLRTILKSSLEVFQARALTLGIRLQVHMADEDCTILGDADLIRHAIDNILDNAFKYRGDSDRIEVSCTRTEKEVRLRIRDYGIGIAKEELSHIHKSFYRVNDPLSQGIRGSGLGLAISRYILKHARAHLTVESKIRKGSSFIIDFPTARATTI